MSNTIKQGDNLISIIIPVYNVLAYLEKCVQSLISQTYTNIEIILVNDGSTDGSEKLCEKFKKDDGRILVIHQKNGGLANARNSGTKASKGAYVFYLDSDDSISLNCISILYEALQKHQAEVVQANLYFEYPEHLLYDNSLDGEDVVLTGKEAMAALLDHKIIKNFSCGNLIRADIAKDNLFLEGKYYEDIFWKYKVINASSKLVVLAQPLLYYLQRVGSITNSFSTKALDWLEAADLRIDFLKRTYPKLVPIAMESFEKLLNNHAIQIKYLKYKDQKIYFSAIRNYEDKYNFRPFKKRFFDARPIFIVRLIVIKIKTNIIKIKEIPVIPDNMVRVEKK